ncbi:hypothetical protein Tco_1097509 [Tanacetum coccineum]
MTSVGIHHRPYPCPTIEINLPKVTDKHGKSLNRPKGKHSNSSTIAVDDALAKVLYRISYDKGISEQMTFREGTIDSTKKPSITDKCNSDVKNSGMQMVIVYDIIENDGSFINEPIRYVNGKIYEHDIRSYKVECREDFNMVDNTFSTENTSIHNVADVEHIDDAHVSHVNKSVNGDDMYKGGSGFVFGTNQGSKGLLKKYVVGLSSVQFGPNLFHKHSSSNAWSFSKFGGKAVNADDSLNIKSFTEKMRKGVEDRELQMSYVP